MASFNINLTGIDRVLSKVGKLKEVEPELTRAVSKSLAELKNRGNALTPKDTGELRNSQFIVNNGLSGTYGYSAKYAPFVEYGHRLVSRGKEIKYINPNPFFAPNVKQQIPIFKSDCKEIIRNKAR